MSETVTWLFIFLTAYWAYCGFFGIRGLRRTKTASEFFLASSGLAPWVYAMAATVASVAGIVLIVQPALVFRDGFQAANAGLIAIGVPLAGVILHKRLWLIKQEYNAVTQGELFTLYFGGNGLRIISAGIALFFAIPFSALLFGATGAFVSELTGGSVGRTEAMWVLSLVVLFYVVLGGLRAVANIGVIQCVLFALVSVFCGGVAFYLFGGFEDFNLALGATLETEFSPWGNSGGKGGGNYNGYFVVPGVIQFTSGLGMENPQGGPWTGVMSLSYMLALFGILASPAFSVLNNANRSIKGLGVQQVWLTGVAVGLLLHFFLNVVGLAANLLGANAELNALGLSAGSELVEISTENSANVLVAYLGFFQDSMPWVLGFFGICVVAAIHATAAVFLSTTSTILVRDIYVCFIDEEASDTTQILAARVCATLLLIAALFMATFMMDAAATLGNLSMSFSAQLFPALLAITWLHWLPKRAVLLGLIAGLIAVVFTENLGQLITGDTLPWGRWPWTIHSAAWGLFFNALICLIVTISGQSEGLAKSAVRIQESLENSRGAIAERRHLKSAAWLFVLAWIFFAVGPGLVIGNDLFGRPDEGFETWMFKMPSIWAWQIIWWAIGVGMIWFLAYKMEMSTVRESFDTPTPKQET